VLYRAARAHMSHETYMRLLAEGQQVTNDFSALQSTLGRRQRSALRRLILDQSANAPGYYRGDDLYHERSVYRYAREATRLDVPTYDHFMQGVTIAPEEPLDAASVVLPGLAAVHNRVQHEYRELATLYGIVQQAFPQFGRPTDA